MQTVDHEQELKQESLSIMEHAAMTKITNQVSYDQAASLLTESIIPFRKRWADYWEPLKRAAWEAHKGIMAKFNDGDQPAERAEKIVKAELCRWDYEQQRIIQQKQREAQAAAEAKEREDRLAAAVMAEDSGANPEEVEAILEAPTTAVAAPVEPTYQKALGVSGRDNWKCKVTDIKALCKAVAAGKVPITYILPNESVLNARAKADRETMNIPGCVAFNDRIISGRSK